MQPLRPGVRTLFVSGYTAETVQGRGKLPPGSAFIEKPFDQLVAAARRAGAAGSAGPHDEPGLVAVVVLAAAPLAPVVPALALAQ